MNDGHSDWCEVVSHGSFDLHFSYNQRCWAFFHVFVGNLYIFLGEMSIQVVCPFFHCSWFTVFCQFSTVQHSDPLTHTCIHSFSHTIFHHFLTQNLGHSSLSCTVGPHCLSILISHKKGQNNAICSNVDATRCILSKHGCILSEVGQKEKDKYHVISLICRT